MIVSYKQEKIKSESLREKSKENKSYNYEYSLDLESKKIEERSWRDSELKASDFIVPLTDHPQYAAYMTYRQDLRDYPSKDTFPFLGRPSMPQ